MLKYAIIFIVKIERRNIYDNYNDKENKTGYS